MNATPYASAKTLVAHESHSRQSLPSSLDMRWRVYTSQLTSSIQPLWKTISNSRIIVIALRPCTKTFIPDSASASDGRSMSSTVTPTSAILCDCTSATAGSRSPDSVRKQPNSGRNSASSSLYSSERHVKPSHATSKQQQSTTLRPCSSSSPASAPSTSSAARIASERATWWLSTSADVLSP